MITKTVDVYFPVMFDMKFENYPFEQRELIIKEISDILPSIQFKNVGYISNYQAKLEWIENPDPFLIYPLEDILYSRLQENGLRFSFNVDVDMSKFRPTTHVGDEVSYTTDPKELDELLSSFLSGEICDKLFEILLLSQIARPGSLKLRGGVTWIDQKKVFGVIESPISLRGAYDHLNDKSYPSVEFLDFVAFHSWLVRHDLIFNEQSKTAFQKALNNFSYLSGRRNTVTELIYQMMTLELLYTDSVNGIADQLDRKIQVFLGRINTHKKQIKKMYDIRSRFLHGELSLSPRHKDYSIEHGSFEVEIDDACDLSALLIIATLQKMYKENRLDLNFEYRLVD